MKGVKVVVLSVESSIHVPTATVVKVVPSVLCTGERHQRWCVEQIRGFGLPERDDVLTNIAVGIPVLSWVVCYAAHKICRLHINCGSVGQSYQCWLVLRVPECGAGAVDGERPTVVGSSVCTVDSDGPAGLGDGSSHDGRGRRGRRDPSERNAIIGRTAFGGELSLAGR